MLRNVGTGLVVNLRWGQASNGMAIDGYLANGTTAQQWRLNPVQGPQEILDQWANENRNLVLDGEYQIRPVVAPNKSCRGPMGISGRGSSRVVLPIQRKCGTEVPYQSR